MVPTLSTTRIGRLRIREDHSRTRLTLPARRRWGTLLFLVIWFVGWSFGGVFALAMLFGLEDGNVFSFIGLWLVFWAIGWVTVLAIIAWQLLGRRRVAIGDGKLVHSIGLPFTIRSRSYDLGAMRGLRWVPDGVTRTVNGRTLPPRGPLRFDHEGYGASAGPGEVSIFGGLEGEEGREAVVAIARAARPYRVTTGAAEAAKGDERRPLEALLSQSRAEALQEAPQDPGRVGVTPHEGGVTVTIPARRSLPVALFMLVWLAAWGAGLLFAGGTLLDATSFIDFAILLFLVPWALVGGFVAWLLLTMLAGREYITVADGHLVHARGFSFLVRRRTYPLGEIHDLHWGPRAFADTAFSTKDGGNVFGLSGLRMLHDTKAVRMAQGLDHREGERVIDALRKAARPHRIVRGRT